MFFNNFRFEFVELKNLYRPCTSLDGRNKLIECKLQKQ